MPLAVSIVQLPTACTAAGVVVTCCFTNLPVGNAPTLDIRTTVKDNAIEGTDLSASTALVTADSNASNNTSSFTVTAFLPTTNPPPLPKSVDDGCAATGTECLSALVVMAVLAWRRQRWLTRP